MNAADRPAAVREARGFSHWRAYFRFLRDAVAAATDGSPLFYAWMTVLTAVALVGVNAWVQQVSRGMGLSHMSDQVSWGLYIANFTFVVGVAAGGVMMVIPAYLYRDHKMHEVVIFGEMLAVAAIIMAMLFVTVDMGRPERFWHLVPGLGQFNFPWSMLTWDIIVLNGYLLLNLHIIGYLLYMRFLKKEPDPRWYVPFVFVSIVWAISIHTVTAFLYAGLGGRPLWNSALLAPRFLVSAFVSGPAFLIVALTLVGKWTRFRIEAKPLGTLVGIIKVTTLLNLFMLVSEVFTEFYSGTHHTASAHYLYIGLDGHYGLVPWIWTAIVLNVGAAALLMHPRIRERRNLLLAACAMAFVGVWIEKGMGLVVPGFIPSPLYELVEYAPSLIEWRITAGVWAIGLLIYSIAIKVGVPILADTTAGEAAHSAQSKPSTQD
ncbi:MAG: polysulfide reductase [Myxococcales bacterium]|nr:MAG: polysulfide reductase [Myxococcales bacterium]